MNYQDSSSDDVPYLPPDQYVTYEQERNNRLSQTTLSQPEQRRGRCHFTEDELRELDSPTTFVDIPINTGHITYTNSIPSPPALPLPRIPQDSGDLQHAENDFHPSPTIRQPHHDSISMSPRRYKISWGRRFLGILLVIIPAVLFSVAVHFIDWSMSDFQLFSASFFMFQGVFWPSFGIFLADLFCTAKKPVNMTNSSKRNAPNDGDDNQSSKSTKQKWILLAWTILHSNLTAAAMIFQILSIQRLNISVSLALSFGFDAVLILFRHILKNKACSPELVIFSIISYAGYAVTAIPAFIADDKNSRFDTAVGVGASIGVMLLSVPASLLLPKLRQANVPESALGTSFAFFGCIHSLITKEIMGSTYNLNLNAQTVGWAAGLISVVFLGTIFLFLETKLSSLIWQRDEDDLPRQFSSISRTRIAVFILSCLWELSRQGFRNTTPSLFDVLGGFLVMISFLLVSGYEAWNKSCQNELYATDSSTAGQSSRKFCAFIPWLFAQKSYHFKNEK